MKILALDLGSRRTGVAIAHVNFIFGRGTICGWEDWERFTRELKEQITKEKINKIIVGVPHSVSGEAAKRVQNIINKIKKEFDNIKIEEIDETLTSAEARRRIGAGIKIDDNEEAAKIILEDYIGKNPN